MGIPRAAVSPCRVLHTIDWEGEQALSGLTLFDARTGIARASTTGSWSRERWVILQGQITGYPETCAEHGVPRSASALVSSVSAFFTAFSRSTGHSTGRTVTVFSIGIQCHLHDL